MKVGSHATSISRAIVSLSSAADAISCQCMKQCDRIRLGCVPVIAIDVRVKESISKRRDLLDQCVPVALHAAINAFWRFRQRVTLSRYLSATPSMTMFRALPSQILLLATLLILGACASSSDEAFDIVEATILEMQEAMEDGRVTSRDLVEAYLLRIAVYEDQVNAVITVNKNALE